MALTRSFAPLNPALHHVKSFRCGKPSMDEFLARHAAKHMKLGISRTWVLPGIEDPQPEKVRLCAYYTLTSSTVTKQDIPFDKSLPGHQIPVVLLARLAVDHEFRPQRLIILNKSIEFARRNHNPILIHAAIAVTSSITLRQEISIFR